MQFGAETERLPSGWHTTTVSLAVIYPLRQEYEYVCRYSNPFNKLLGIGSVNSPMSGGGQVIAEYDKKKYGGIILK